MDNDKKLEYVDDITNWHPLDIIELGLHTPEPCEECHKIPCECSDEKPKPCPKCGNRPCTCKRPDRENPEQQPGDPLIIDLNRDGKVSTAGSKRYFDLDANGVAEEVSWAASGDGILALDRDGNGIITSGEELFGDKTPLSDGTVARSGFKALADLDSNGDGVIDARDEQFKDLRVWADGNGDGAFSDKELYSLEEVGIESIDLKYVEQNLVDENGNRIVRSGKVTWSDGDTGLISEFLLQRETEYSIYPHLDVPNDIASLPDIEGSGYLYSLHQAMVRDASGELQELVERFVETKDPVIRRGLFDQIMGKWGVLSDMEKVSSSGWLGFLSKFYGQDINMGRPTARGERQMRMNYEAVTI